ncbi:elongation factor P maturation arginine rhamnosyltransferase EarP [Hydrogenophaga sp.]|uniref:elongation factor P maturation arginine rhamnosyltransferase EarP n=1 Tax=Hydrogenophaga sp. TaxID=1904254 RepID=UPI0019A29F85|nr:elongation factor P maturation arginine rhamnosyltransferase EarP [Hydrogenophaga sp.]MBD3893898.1 elongation factor P maturation arginine rhamnosyltransferase EarP [Hydrogenophaga sp.]
MPAATAPHRTPPLTWDVFCHVVDNLGDIGVCWRLCADLAARGQRVRLWIDEPGALRWMAPGALEGRVHGVRVLPWTTPLAPGLLAQLPLADVWIETFGCHPPPQAREHWAAALAAGERHPVWINLEYMSAQPYVERSHGLPSLVSSGPLRGVGKWFFYPGFSASTGGLLREPDLPVRQAAFDAAAWLASKGLPNAKRPRASLFCYEPVALPAVLQQAGADTASDWLVTAGRAGDAVGAAQAQGLDTGHARLHRLPRLTQRDYDHLLWACELNFVRGEDSLVRALWAGQPLVWQIYPQHDDAHHAKLEAFLDWLRAPASLRAFHRAWNGMELLADPIWPGWTVLESWRACVQAARARLLAQPDLVSQLLQFVAEKR